MRIAYVCSDRGIPVFGRKGSSIHVQSVTRALIRAGVQVDLFAHRVEGEPPAGLESVTVHPIPGVNDSSDPEVHARALAELNAALASELPRFGPFDAVYERYSLWSHAALEYAREAGIPGVLEVNAPLIEEQERHRGLNNRESAEGVATRVFGAAAALIAVSKEVANYVEGFDVARGRVHVVLNAVDPTRFQEPEPRPERKPGEFTVGFLGSLRPWHGLEPLVEAFAILHERDSGSRLLIVGDGPEREKLEANLERAGVAAVTELTGAIAPAAVPAVLSRMDVAVAPYADAEDFYFSPLKVFEYMAAGLPVVASRIGQLGEIIDEGRTGFLCPPGDPRALVEVLEQLRGDPDLRHRIGQQARETVLREHTWDARVQTIFRHAGIRQ